MAFWRGVVRFQSDKLDPKLAMRNTIGVTLPLVIGAATGSMAGGLIASSGALNVAFRDNQSPYPERGRHLLQASVIAGLAVFLGSLCGNSHWMAVMLATAWAFAAGMLVALGQAPGDLGTMSLVMLCVYSGVPLPLHQAALSGLAAFGGGLLQTGLAVALWPLGRYAPERRALGALFSTLAGTATSPPADAGQALPATAQSNQAQTTLAALAREETVESERFQMLLSQAERIRMSLFTLARLRIRIERDRPAAGELEILDRTFELPARILQALGEALTSGRTPADHSEECRELDELADQLRALNTASPSLEAKLDDARRQIDALVGQLRSAIDLASNATPAGSTEFARRESKKHWTLQWRGTIATLRANLNVESAAFRHVVRLAVSIAAGDALAMNLGLSRSYWIAMTIALVLKPDFGSTFSRGVLRLGGTLGGVVFATGLFHALPQSLWVQIATIAALMFVLRWIGGANYGIFAVAVTALVVYLLALKGTVTPGDAMRARAINTMIGGAIALIAYAAWPTWERHQVADAMAQMLDKFRAYFHELDGSYRRNDPYAAALDRARVAGRLARTNLEASIERAMGEPGISAERVSLLKAMLASSHRLAYALLALEAGIAGSSWAPPRDAFGPFARDVELTLYHLASALRGSRIEASALPDLREDHHALIHSSDSQTDRYALVNVETDRITNSLNTLSGEILNWIGRDSIPGIR